MRRLLNTLYVTTPGAYLARDGENVLVRIEEETKFRVPVHNLEGIVCFGYAGASPGVMDLCCERGVALSFLTEYGQFKGRVTGPVTGNILLRRTQYRWADSETQSLRMARRFIQGKILNSRAVLSRGIRDHREQVDAGAMEMAVRRLGNILERVAQATDADQLRGMEGEAAQLYFEQINQLILWRKESFFLEGRNRRPPLDRVNALISFLYTLLCHECEAALESVGLDPQAGFLHKDRPGRASLALDMMEEMRAHLADRLALTMINRQQIQPEGFSVKENGAVIMDETTRKEVLMAWQKRKQEEIEHPFLEEKIPIGLIPYTQALLMARHMRGDLDDYPPFIWK